MFKKSLSLIVLFLAAAVVRAEMKIAVVDMQTLINAHPLSIKNSETFETLSKQAQTQEAELTKKMRELYEKCDELAAIVQNPVYNDTKRKEANAEAQKYMEQAYKTRAELERLRAKNAQELNLRRMQFFKETIDAITPVIQEVVKEKKVDLLLDTSTHNLTIPTPTVLYASAALDLTDEVIARTGGKREVAEKLFQSAQEQIDKTLNKLEALPEEAK